MKKKIEIKINEASKIHFSNIFEQVNYIPLETTDSSLIGTVERLRIFDNKVCLLSDKSLLLFNKQSGNVELQLSKLGSAPEDYKSLYDVYIDNEMGEIELLDMNGQKILCMGNIRVHYLYHSCHFHSQKQASQIIGFIIII